jgi:hypothetical protein
MSAVEERKDDAPLTWETNDMSLAAWMRAKDMRLVSIHRGERRKEFRFVFDDPDGECPGHALDYLNSDAHAYDTALRALKKMCFGPSGIVGAVSKSRR